jgi:hypothetical protein
LCYSFLSVDYVLTLAEKELGNILGDFFTNSSGHPAPLFVEVNFLKRVPRPLVAQFWSRSVGLFWLVLPDDGVDGFVLLQLVGNEATSEKPNHLDGLPPQVQNDLHM